MYQEICTYEEIDESVRDCFAQSIRYGFTPLEAIARNVNEFQRIAENTEIEGVMVYLVQGRLMLENHTIHTGVREKLERFVENDVLSKLTGTIDTHQLAVVKKDLADVYSRLSEY